MSAKVEPQISGAGASKRQAPEEAPGLSKLLCTLFACVLSLIQCSLLLQVVASDSMSSISLPAAGATAKRAKRWGSSEAGQKQQDLSNAIAQIQKMMATSQDVQLNSAALGAPRGVTAEKPQQQLSDEIVALLRSAQVRH
jgi:hypothetical protein